MKGNLYELDLQVFTETALAVSTIELWHHRVAHIQHADIKSMEKSEAVRGLEINNNIDSTKTCSGCVLGKAHRAAVPEKSHSRSTKLLQSVHSDVNGS